MTKKSNIKSKSESTGYSLIRTIYAGVHVAKVVKLDRATGTADVEDARIIHRWRGANTLRELALHGADTAYTRISEPVLANTLLGVIEVIPIMDQKVAENLTRSRWPQ